MTAIFSYYEKKHMEIVGIKLYDKKNNTYILCKTPYVIDISDNKGYLNFTLSQKKCLAEIGENIKEQIRKIRKS